MTFGEAQQVVAKAVVAAGGKAAGSLGTLLTSVATTAPTTADISGQFNTCFLSDFFNTISAAQQAQIRSDLHAGANTPVVAFPKSPQLTDTMALFALYVITGGHFDGDQ